MRYTLNLKKKTQRDLEIIACGLNSKKTKKNQTSAGRRKCEKAFFLIIKKNLQVSACICAVISVL